MKATSWHRARAGDPSTPPEELAALAAGYPDLHVVIAANPACPDDLFDQLTADVPGLGSPAAPLPPPPGPAVEVPLTVPLYGAGPRQAVSRFFRNYAVFTGRASRAEYWWMALLQVVVVSAFAALALSVGAATGTTTSTGVTMGPGAAAGLVPLALWLAGTLIPSLAITVRRLHDAGFSGSLILLGLIPYLGELVVLLLMLLPPSPTGVRFDPRPADAVPVSR